MENVQQYAPFIAFVLGVVARIVIPYALAWINDHSLKFDIRFVVGQLVGAAVALIPLVTTAEFIAELGAMAWVAAFALGWASGDIGREGQKLVTTR